MPASVGLSSDTTTLSALASCHAIMPPLTIRSAINLLIYDKRYRIQLRVLFASTLHCPHCVAFFSHTSASPTVLTTVAA